MIEKKARNSYSLASRDYLTEKTYVLLYDHKLLIIDKNMPVMERIKLKGKITKIVPFEPG